jgi:CheY-like chemotaxis protein
MEGESPRRLLVLDDDELGGVLVEAIGRLAGLRTWRTEDHASFFLALQDFRPDLIFLDLTMPAMAGEDVLRGLAHRHCTARVIISSGASAERLVDAAALARQCGLATAGTLVKPFAPADLRALLVL